MMTARLEQAVKRLSPEDLEEVTRLAEALAERQTAVHPPKKMRFEWAGALKDEPEQSGVEAQHTAMREWLESIQRKLSR